MGMLLGPFRNAAHTQEIAVVLQQLLETGSGNIGKLDLGFLGSAARLAALENILFARAGGLHHLVVGARPFVDKPVAKFHGAIVDNAGFLKGVELLIAPVWRDKALGRGRKGLRGRRLFFVPESPFCPLRLPLGDKLAANSKESG
jgi:hypothetical protein